jgi:tRNA/tmRNA/rRNA uracil-C5-methylase (TrmA/RlmC/RlmD family)
MSIPAGREGKPIRSRDTAPLASGSLEGFILQEAAKHGAKLPAHGAAVLAHLEYGLECRLKEGALCRFWKHQQLPGRPETLVASPRSRHYRTTSKRRGWRGLNAEPRKGKNAPMPIFAVGDGSALLEPEEHAAIYSLLEELLARAEFSQFARALNFVIIRGTYDEFMIIFNLQSLDRDLHRQLLKAVGALRALKVNIVSAFLFLDASRSPYYLEADRPRGAFPIKRLFGPERFRLRLGKDVFTVPVTSFSQVNESILPALLATARAMTAGENGGRLLDLYCGYGLFALSQAALYKEIFAIDLAPGSITAGRDMLSRFQGGGRVHFRAAAIQRNSLAEALPPPLPAGMEDVILDPPRRGADRGVIASIARRRPARVLHLFCAADEVPEALGHWRQCGYFVRRVVALDMFAGTPQLEILVLLTPA